METAPARATRSRRQQDLFGNAEARSLRDRVYRRREVLLRDAREVSNLFAPNLAVLAFRAGPSGKSVLFGNPTVESVLRRFLPAAEGVDAGTETAARVAAMRRDTCSIEARVRAVAEKVKAAQAEQGREHWWEVDVDALGEEELPEFAAALDVLRTDVLCRLHKLAKPPQRH